jgi:hypothetical protein
VLPPEIAVYVLLSQRVPRIRWDVTQLFHTVGDFTDVDVVEVAGRCALYLNETPAARNGVRTFRTFLERERKERSAEHDLQKRASRLSMYHRPLNS